MGNRRTGALGQVSGGGGNSDLKKFVSFADFWKKGCFWVKIVKGLRGKAVQWYRGVSP
jgi:hypothetical protein